LTLLVPFSYFHNYCICELENSKCGTQSFTSKETRYNKRRHTKKSIYFQTHREVTGTMKFHFSILGNAEADTETILVDWLHDMVSDYNERSGSPIDNYQVLISEETQND
jgi:hypothetical protein